MTYTKPPFFQWATRPAASRGLGDPPADDCVCAGVHFGDPLIQSRLQMELFTCDPAATVVSFAFWAKVARTSPPASQFYEMILFEKQDLSAARWHFDFISSANPASISNTPCQVNGTEIVGQTIAMRPGFTGFLIELTETPNDSEWCFFLGVINTGDLADPGAVWVNGQFMDYRQYSSVGPQPLLNMNGQKFCLGSTEVFNDTDGLIGDLAEVWFKVGVDLREPDGTFSDATINKFMAPGHVPRFLGDQGELPTGSPADLYFHRCEGDPLSEFLINRGTGGGPLVAFGHVTVSALPIPGTFPRPLPYRWDITGTVQVGQVLTVVDGAALFANGPITLIVYQWQILGGNFGADQPTYVVDNFPGFNVNCYVVATNAAGSFVVNSEYVGPIVP